MSQTEEVKAPLFENLRKLITLIDELRDVGLQQYIELPRIVVVGSQSAGKSSLLESIVGMDFLPRGEGVVTRRPLELRLVHVPPTDTEFKPYAVFPKDGNEKFFDFSKVYAKINELTDKVCGKDKGIIDDPITMTVYSQTTPDLTLVDLPGITRIPIAGQPKDIEKITKDMCRRYASNKRTIILAVMPANQDMSTSDALQLAQQEDPEGLRTIGVITKIDIMDKGTDARKMLLGQEIPLKLGFVGVKGRSQEDIRNKMAVKDALKIEKDYFATHPGYSALPPGMTGTLSLTQKLTKVLFGHIRNTLPEIAKEIQIKIKECEERLKDLGDPLPVTSKEKMQLIWNMITDFVENFKNNLAGKYDAKRNHRVVEKDLSGGAKIKMMYNELYTDFVGKRATENMTDAYIHKAIVLHQGDSIPGFPSFDSFLYLLAPLLRRLRDPGLALLNDVHIYLETITNSLIEKIFARFPSVIDDINDIVGRVLREEKEIAKELLEEMISAEQTYIFTNDIQYMTTRTSIIPTQEVKPGQPIQKVDPDKLFVDEMRNRIDAYFFIVLRNIRDSVPKIIGHFLVKSCQEKLQYNLYNEINKNEQLLNTVGEPPHITAERDTLHKVLDVLNKAKRVLTKDPDLAPQFQQTTNKPERKFEASQSKSDSSGFMGKVTGMFGGKEEPQKVEQRPTSSQNTKTMEQPKTNPNQSQGGNMNQPQSNNPFGGGGGGSTNPFGPSTGGSNPNTNTNPFGGNPSVNDVKNTVKFVNENKEDIKKAAQFVNENKETIQKTAGFIADNKETIQKGVNTANNAGLFGTGGDKKPPSSSKGLFGF